MNGHHEEQIIVSHWWDERRRFRLASRQIAMLGRTCDAHKARSAKLSSHGPEGFPRISKVAIALD